MQLTERHALEFLGELERREARLLSWGVVDTGFTADEVAKAADDYAAAQHGAVLVPDDLIALLRERRLLFWLDGREGTLVRTRMAETVRLCARLRQLFPKHMRGGAWRVAPTLVADYRLLLRPRAYPKREFRPNEVMEHVARFTRVTGVRRASLAALLGEAPDPRVLARFQRDAVAAILAALDEGRSRGVIVCAGTGSGKTLAFYLPALAHIAASVDAGHWTKALAIYPRNELLKDQFTETYREARRLDATLKVAGRRKIIIGAYFGPTPRTAGHLERKAWRLVSSGRVCPFIRCPTCDADMVWPHEDAKAGRERLCCMRKRCGAVLTEDEVMLTRARMERTPPDVLFTTTEMLNRNLGNAETWHVFGLGPRVARGPDLVLLDEVHTYSGTSGAQAALLLRRWRHALGRPVRFVGLSATLRDASRFFARLIGLPEADVTLLEPGTSDLTREGMEYLLALRGDPASGASMLATTIQVSMLLRRMLDEPDGAKSRGAYGTKLFAFTDNLDTVNRLYFDLLDAEGLDSFGHPLPGRPYGSLATLRARDHADVAARAVAGQLWEVPEEIGHVLTPETRLTIERTSSQDVGVDPRADIVVATSTLEVGFNDPLVGAVLQHKAPLDAAQFLQRKGRAGRQRTMRPWTVVVLSDYGRDRLAYQGYEVLFDPILEPRHLPTGNRHVLRIQAVQSLADWLAVTAAAVAPGSVWDDLSGPASELQAYRGARATQRQHAIVSRLESVLTDSSVRAELAGWLRQALRVSPEEVQVLFWEPPRALLTAVIPTALRRLRSQWGRAQMSDEPPPRDAFTAWHPLPDFMPANLFSDLDLPEVIVSTPPQKKGGEPEDHPMPVAQALSEFAPGRVSRRFGVMHRYVRHWVAPPDLRAPLQDLPITAFCPTFDRVGAVQVRDADGTIRDVMLVRPHRLAVVTPPSSITDSSNGRLQWQSQIWPVDGGACVEVPHGTAWASFLCELRFFTHNARSGVEVRRFALTSTATLAFESGEMMEATLRFVDGAGDVHTPVAPGFAFRADGLVVRFRWPDDLDVEPTSTNPQKIRGCRTEYFRHRVLTASSLDGIANHFQRLWLAQVYESALVMVAIQRRTSLREAGALLGGDLRAAMASVLDAIFQTLPASDQAAADGRPTALVQRVHGVLLQMIDNPVVADTLLACGKALWALPDEGWHHLARDRFRATLAAAVLRSCEALCPEFGARDLVVDLDPGPRPPCAPTVPGVEEIWLTEDGPGGGGVVEEIARRVAEDPRRFLRLAEAALLPTDFATVDVELRKVLAFAASDPSVRAALEGVRGSRGNDATWQAFEALRAELTRKGVVTSHAVVAALSARVLRPGTSTATDALLRDLVDRWIAEETRLGVEVDARVFAYACAEDSSLDAALEDVAALAGGDLRQWRFGTVYSLLWPRGSSIRSQGLRFRSPYAEAPAPDPDLVGDRLRALIARVHLNDAGWEEQLAAHLRATGQVEFVAAPEQRSRLRREVLALVAAPVDVGGLLVYPRIVGLRARPDETAVRLELREVFQ